MRMRIQYRYYKRMGLIACLSLKVFSLSYCPMKIICFVYLQEERESREREKNTRISKYVDLFKTPGTPTLRDIHMDRDIGIQTRVDIRGVPDPRNPHYQGHPHGQKYRQSIDRGGYEWCSRSLTPGTPALRDIHTDRDIGKVQTGADIRGVQDS